MHRIYVFWLALALALSGLSLAGCGGPITYNIVGTERVPSAEGRIQVERIDGGNNLVTVSIQHLAPPERLSDGLSRYVMWFRPEGAGAWDMESNLEYNPDDRSGSATATTPRAQFQVLITSEGEGEVSQPSDVVVFRQAVNAG